jgi:2-hydroxy-3-oxopropionate reductase
MGTAMVRNLLKVGYEVCVYNRTATKAEALLSDGVEIANTPAKVAERSEIILACLLDSNAVEDVVKGKNGILTKVHKDQVFVDLSTSSPESSVRLAEALGAKGCNMLDAPVSGGEIGAQEGTLSIMVGGDPNVFEHCLPVLNVLGKRVTLVGEAVGYGGYAKLANQIMVAINLVSMSEALVFGAKAGLSVEKLATALGGGLANSSVLQVKFDKILSRQFTPGGRVKVHLKDLGYIADSLRNFDIELPVLGLVHELFRELVDDGFGDEDHVAIIRAAEKAAGIRVT